MCAINFNKVHSNMNSNNSFFANYLEHLSITNLTDIQSVCMQPMFEGKSVFGLAPTGSGKTLAFVLPLLLKVESQLRDQQILILVPTRELGNQIASVANKVAQAIFKIDGKNILVRTIFGGTPISSQIEEVSKNPHVLIATPGRILDLLERNALDLLKLKSLILDEADIMVGMGFSDQVEAICDFLPENLQVGLFSATKNEKVTHLEKLLLGGNDYLNADVENIQNNSGVQKFHDSEIKHQYINVGNKESKYQSLVKFLKKCESSTHIGKGIIFCHTRETSHQLAESLKNEGFAADALSGELGQVHRNSIMRNFKNGTLKYLVATNIAGRGIDVAKLSLVIHYDIPYTQDEYIHRSGRTGRAGNNGLALALCEAKVESYYLNLMKELSIQAKPFDKDFFVNQNSAEERPEGKNQHQTKIKFSKVYINKGKQDKMRPGDILGAFIKELSLEKEDLGNIFIFDNFTHVELNSDKLELALKKKFRIKNLQVKMTEAK
ncbi:DEAD/DEAH box helicase [Fluviispira multicolorata]|uniref:DEAD/DEAH box helicase n=1 Tax=Fluviispira multicolorata TaxID=2654512 RepID=A0A833JAU9_9BACT|nr:DEAD/DEAH box helicase [Fluviispira multicolorata]KAB8027713.1 DEAD/DEAH box helicase [Fluviispira multicolorata]